MKTCVITGAGSGIGRATSLDMVKCGAADNYILISLGQSELEETKQMMQDINCDVNVEVFDQDITIYNETHAIIDNAYKKYGSIDYLCNIAGFSKAVDFEDVTVSFLEKTFQINVFAMFAITQFCVKYMKLTGGVIVNIASTSGSTPRPGWISYAASKSAVIGFSRTLSKELESYNIKVFNLSPGRCATVMRKGLCPTEENKDMMKPEMVADMITGFIVNPHSGIDGQDIVIRKV